MNKYIKLFLGVYLGIPVIVIISIAYSGINRTTNLNVENLTDVNWENGVLRTDKILLFKNSEFQLSTLQNARLLKTSNITTKIQMIEHDFIWIKVRVEENVDIKAFRYPAPIEIIGR